MEKTPSTEKNSEKKEKVKAIREMSSVNKAIVKNFCLTERGEKFFAEMYRKRDFETLFIWTLQVMDCYLDLQKRFEAEP